MDKEFRKQAIIQLARQEYNDKIKTVLNQEIDQISIILLENDEYYTLVESLSLLDYIAFRETAKSLKIIDKFLERLRTFFIAKEAIFKIYELEEMASKSLAIVNHIRYHDVKAVLNLLKTHFNSFGNKKIKDKIISIIENLSEYNIDVISKVNLAIQDKIMESLGAYKQEERITHSSVIAIICKNILSCETRAESSTYDAFTFRRGSIRATDAVKKIRSDAIKILEETYDLIQQSSSDKIEKNAEIIESLNHACWQDSQSEKNDQDFYDLFNLVLDNAKEVTRFYASKINDSEYKLILAMENSLARLYYRTSEISFENTPNEEVVKTNSELKVLIEKFRDTAKQDEEYVIYRELVSGYLGLRSIDKGYWGEEYGEDKRVVEGYANSVNENNLNNWLSRIFRIIKTENDKHLFPIQNFLITLTKKSPDLAVYIIKSKSKEINDLNIDGYDNIVVSSILFGLFGSSKQDAKELIINYIEKGLYLKECISSISGDKNNLDFTLLKKLFDRAKKDIEDKKENSDVLLRFIQIVNHNHSQATKQESKNFILEIIKELIIQNNSGWIRQVYPNSFMGEIIEGLSNIEDVKIILDAMISIERIDYSDEEVLARLSKKYPEEVVGFFANRLKKEKPDNVTRYDAIPYDFYNKELKKELAKCAKILLKNARNNHDKNPSMFMFRWGKLLQIVFGDLPDSFIDELVRIAQKENEKDIEFILGILRSLTSLRDCRDIEKLKKVCKAVIQNPLYQEEKFYSELSIALTSTGVVSGKYGFAEAREKRVAEMKGWENDNDEKVINFYRKFSKSELENAREERIRADAQEELRKYDFENS